MQDRTDTERILQLWDFRECFLCQNRGPCAHREIEVARAEIEREDLRLTRGIRKPPESEPAKIRSIQ